MSCFKNIDIFVFKCFILQYLYNLSDPSLEDALIECLGFQRFPGISFYTEITDFTTIWRFSDDLSGQNLRIIYKSILKQLDNLIWGDERVIFDDKAYADDNMKLL